MVLTCQELPSQADGSGFITLAMFNICSGRNGGLKSALRAMAKTEVGCGILTETKITGDIYTCFSLWYNVFALNTNSVRQGGIAFFWRDNNFYEIKETKFWGPNVLSFELVTSATCFYVVGAYILPLDPGTALSHVELAWKKCPAGCKCILLGNLNANVLTPHDECQDTITEMVDSMDLLIILDQFQQRQQHRSRGSSWTWGMRRGG